MSSAEALIALAELQADTGLLGTVAGGTVTAAQLRARVQLRIDALRDYLVSAPRMERTVLDAEAIGGSRHETYRCG